MASILFNVW